MKIVAVIQARMGSTRLPGKVLLPILGHPMLWHIVTRLKSVSRIDEVVIATSISHGDDRIESFCTNFDITLFRGSEEDVLDRFYNAAKMRSADHVIRVTADCPLIDPETIQNLIDIYLKNGYDHCGVATGAGAAKEGFVGRFPDGLDTEIFSYSSLEQAWKESTEKIHREHVTAFIWQQPDRFKIGQLKSEIDYSNVRLTVDNSEDFGLIRWIYEELYPKKPKFSLKDVTDLLKTNHDRLKLNKHLIGKEGYEEFWK